MRQVEPKQPPGTAEYRVEPRRIAGTHREKLDQIDAAIDELLELKRIESGDGAGVHYLASRRHSHVFGMSVVILALLVLLVLLLGTRSARGQTPEQTPQPLPSPAALAEDPFWSELKLGFTLEGYYQYDWNDPPDRAIALRAYDTRHNSFSIQQAAVVFDYPTDVDNGRRFGARVDFQYGQATEALQGNPANEPRPDVYRPVWQAYGSYVFPVQRGLRIDFGKWASSLGYETNYAKDNQAFSRAYLFNFLPYYHSGVRVSLPASERVTLQYMLVNGIQQTEDFNDFKSQHVAAILKPIPWISWTVNYYFGQEQPDGGEPGGPDGFFRVFDTYLTATPTSALTLGLDVNYTTNEVLKSDDALALQGIGAYIRYRVSLPAALGLRYERVDDEGLFGGIDQLLQEATLTAELKLAGGFLLRGELRRDWSNESFFPGPAGSIDPRKHQNTALIGGIWYVGNKTGTW